MKAAGIPPHYTVFYGPRSPAPVVPVLAHGGPRACAWSAGCAILSRGSTVWTAVADERRRGFMTTPGNPQDSPQGHTEPGNIPPPGQPGYDQQDSPQGHSPRGASDDQALAMVS